MSTHAILARPRPGGFEGVYLHSDGYPTWTLVRIGELVRAYGVETVRAILTEAPAGWSTIGADQIMSWHKGDGFEVVEGYGVRYAEDEPADLITIADSGDWVYVLHDDHVEVRYGKQVQADIAYSTISRAVANRIEYPND